MSYAIVFNPFTQKLQYLNSADGRVAWTDITSGPSSSPAQIDSAVTKSSTVLNYKGVIDCSTNPNYPSGVVGDLYVVSVAGIIGGLLGVPVTQGDLIICKTNNAGGTQASVGADWDAIQVALNGEVIGPISSTDSAISLFDGTSGKLIKDSGKVISTDGTLAGNSDNNIPTQKATKTYVDALGNDLKPLGIEVIFDGGGSALAVSQQIDIVIPFACTLTQVELVADQSGSVVIDIYKCTYAQYDGGVTHPVVGDKITSSTPPTITSSTKYTDSSLSSWTKSFAAGDILRFNVNSATTITRCNLTLYVTRS